MGLSVLFANTFLLRVPGPGPLAWLGDLHSKPAVRERASEFGEAVGDYDVVALCEVFQPDDLDRMIVAWAAAERPDAAIGPGPRTWAGAGSGLVTLARPGRIVRSQAEEFADQGSKLRDSDAWSAKGVLVTEIELPEVAVNLEIVSTHLIAGGDFGDTERHRRATEEVRFGQVAEVLDLAARAHESANAQLIVGDFNVAAGTAAGDRLNERMGAAGYRDLWLDHGVGSGWTSDPIAVGEAITRPDPMDRRFCDDPAEDHPDAQRIDYAFWRQGDGEPPEVAVRTMRRRVFPRQPDGVDGEAMPLLSDHAALHLELEVRDSGG